jgi:tetratricopeptide (TPR) repeat protein
VILALAALAAALWLALVWFWGRGGAEAYRAGEDARAESRYSLAASLMVAEKWKALFGQGTAVLAGGDAARAEGLLEGALELTPSEKECVVRINLSLAQERQGDEAGAAGDSALAAELWQTALDTLRAGRCPARDDTAAEAQERLNLKLESAGEDDSGGDSSGAGQDDPDDPDDQEGQEGQEDPPSPSPSPGPAEPSDAPSDPAEPDDELDADLQERLDRLRDQTRRGQLERQNPVDPESLLHYWEQPLW